ncbi:hypothetical protein HYQ45_017131 [Verticillium longisporum]|uniref:DUF7729 domain-containing protein n=2 Tax=Verticillium TaxID=1036719 RepID=A0A8I2Z7D5_VERLO|nr:hypothetical protein HYQ45_017131 [Verticillium longisporum]PNH45382.1 hypothetical protein VD0004_g2498 [Verticillium dahliae]PNH72933.1 hypothetical protein VD0001_g4615 [Verticillium dahliae]RBQ70676.1 hypothetical protein VDGD_09764 [Verticillium dahliae]RXG43211.1 hypothetical protein VDGE_09764 [Verticillium dahliae]
MFSSTPTCPAARSPPASSMSWASRFLLVTLCLASSVLGAAVPFEDTLPALTPRQQGVGAPYGSAMASGDADLRKRQEDEDESTTTIRRGTPTITTASERTTTASTARLSITPPSTSTDVPAALPSPFDSSMASTFTNTDNAACPNFINALLSNSDFKRCYPISMLLLSSNGFFEASKSLVNIVRVLDAGCEVDFDFCKAYLGSVAEQLIKDENCGPDYKKGHAVVRDAYMGLTTYETVYKATCLQNKDDAMYCYATATTFSDASNIYPYHLPFNLTFPGSATPECSWCLSETMRIFHAQAADRRKLISLTYESAARQINTVCGPEFVNETLPEAVTGSLAGVFLPPWAVGVVALSLGLIHNLL